ncbi:MAG: gliding motility-associated C-terminal domain-containing protein [Chitinophagaceae bacterium]|nr:gliding motility-associated C-terminal domain-containing protein [Chitinophagaceae bacterium]
MRSALFVLLLFIINPLYPQVTAGFTTVEHACVNTPVIIQNTTVGGANYYWSFCAADFNSTPESINLGNPGGLFSTPVFSCYAQDDNKNFYGLVCSYNSGHLIRLNFGNSLLNNPTAEDLGTFNDALPNQCEGIQLLRVNGRWTALIVGGGNQAVNSSPRIVKIDFGSSLTSTPAATNWGNVGGLNLPHELFVAKEGSNYYGFAINVNDNTITQLSFGPDFTNPPTGVNLGNIGNINYPAGFTFVNYQQNWYALIANRVTNSLTRLSFGASLQNTPVGVNIGNPGGMLSFPRDVSLFTTCDGVYGFVVNETSNDLVKLNFGTDITSAPAATNLGNTGNLSFPHSISDLFRVGNDIYAFILNNSNNTLTRIRFAGCQDIPGSNVKDPSPVTYQRAGLYNINLLVDLGLPTQTSFCRQVRIDPAPLGMFKGDTVCYGSSPVLLFATTDGTAPFSVEYDDGSNSYTQNNLDGHSPMILPHPLTTPGSTTFKLHTITDVNGCKTTSNLSSKLVINPLPQGGISGSRACSADSAVLYFTAGSGIQPFQVQLSDGVSIYTKTLEGNGQIKLKPLSASTDYSLLAITDSTGCIRTSGFTSPAVNLHLYTSPTVEFSPLEGVCYNKHPFMITAGQEISGLAGTGLYSGAGIDAQGNFQPLRAGAGTHMLIYTYTTDDGCTGADSTPMVVYSLPPVAPAQTIDVCGGTPIRISAGSTGRRNSYSWTPAFLLSDATSPDPVATVDSTTMFIAQVTDSNGCSSLDTVVINAPVNSKTVLAVPNSFTPNGDGHNDCFGIQRWGQVTVEEFSVFNRHGARVFSTKNPSECWNGTYNGEIQPTGGYVYVIRARSFCGQVTRTGIVILVR